VLVGTISNQTKFATFKSDRDITAPHLVNNMPESVSV